MLRRAIEGSLLVVAAGLFTWGIFRAISRGEPAVTSWTTYLITALLALSFVNLWLRSTIIALILIIAAGFLAAVALAAALLGQSLLTNLAFLRAMFVLLSLAAIGLSQMRKT